MSGFLLLEILTHSADGDSHMADSSITMLMTLATRGDRAADERLIEAVVSQLEQIARREMAAVNRGGLGRPAYAW